MVSGHFVPGSTTFRATNWDIENLITFAYGYGETSDCGRTQVATPYGAGTGLKWKTASSRSSAISRAVATSGDQWSMWGGRTRAVCRISGCRSRIQTPRY